MEEETKFLLVGKGKNNFLNESFYFILVFILLGNIKNIEKQFSISKFLYDNS